MSLTVVILGLALSAQVTDAPDSSAASSFQSVFADCVVTRKASQAQQFVVGRGSPPVVAECLRGEWAQASFLDTTFRYMLARALLLREYAAGIPDGLVGVGEVSAAPVSSRQKTDPDASRRLALADCVARRAPSQAFALAHAEAGEGSAEGPMNDLAPALAACSAQVKVRYPRGFQVQEAIVTRLYQLAFAFRRPTHA